MKIHWMISLFKRRRQRNRDLSISAQYKMASQSKITNLPVILARIDFQTSKVFPLFFYQDILNDVPLKTNLFMMKLFEMLPQNGVQNVLTYTLFKGYPLLNSSVKYKQWCNLQVSVRILPKMAASLNWKTSQLQEAAILYWVEDKDLWFWLFFFYQDF